MKLPRRSRIVGTLLALVSMLFMQMVLAGYVCPSGAAAMEATIGSVQVGVDTMSMPGCDHVDMKQPSLCHANAHTAQQSLDKHELPALQAFVPGSLTLVLPNPEFQSSPLLLASVFTRLPGAPAPPLAIRHCCFRI